MANRISHTQWLVALINSSNVSDSRTFVFFARLRRLFSQFTSIRFTSFVISTRNTARRANQQNRDLNLIADKSYGKTRNTEVPLWTPCRVCILHICRRRLWTVLLYRSPRLSYPNHKEARPRDQSSLAQLLETATVTNSSYRHAQLIPN